MSTSFYSAIDCVIFAKDVLEMAVTQVLTEALCPRISAGLTSIIVTNLAESSFLE
jgi:hypothetical protein